MENPRPSAESKEKDRDKAASRPWALSMALSRIVMSSSEPPLMLVSVVGTVIILPFKEFFSSLCVDSIVDIVACGLSSGVDSAGIWLEESAMAQVYNNREEHFAI